jgi:hypothetical protein
MQRLTRIIVDCYFFKKSEYHSSLNIGGLSPTIDAADIAAIYGSNQISVFLIP